jgi:hypothetical protein
MADLRTYGILFACLALLLNGCATSLHGSFVAVSYTGDVKQLSDAEVLGQVEGRSCQTRPLYIFATGDPATTHGAIEDAKRVRENTAFIADISIDDETEWKIGYAVQCIVVRATAYR